nr:hypothetical protein [Tanacetum cinerariifolium]
MLPVPPSTAVEPSSSNTTKNFSVVGPSNTDVSLNFEIGEKSSFVDPSQYPDDPNMSALEDIIYSDDEEDVGAAADFSNLETSKPVSPISITRVHKNHHVTQIIGDLSSAHQIRSMTRVVKEQVRLTQINDEDFHTCMFACFLSQEEPKRVHQALKDPSWIKAMHEELLQFKMQKGHTQEEGIDYKEVFALVVRIEAIRLFLAYASFMGFMDLKTLIILISYLLENGFQRGNIDQTLFIKKQKGDILLVQVYVDDIIFGSTNKELCKAFKKLMKDKFQMSSMGELTFFLRLKVKKKDDGIFISQDKYVAEILRKFGLIDGKSASTPIDTEKPLLKDPDGEDVDVHIYSDYARASLDRKSTTGGCQFLGCRLICWQCKKQTVVATSSTEVEYVAAYALMVNPTIYVSCMKQFWTSVLIKKSNDVVRLQALIDRKKVIIIEDLIRQALDDAGGVDCLLNEEIFAELAWMGYEKPSTKLTFYKALFLAQWKFLIHTILQCMSAKRTAWNEFSSSMDSGVICLTTVNDLSSHNTKNTSPTLTQKVFANMRRIGKGFSGVDTPLFDGMLTRATLTKQVANLEQDKIAQAIEITKLKQRVRRLEKKRQFKSSRLKRLRKVRTAQRVESLADTVMDDQEDASKQGGKIVKLDADEDFTLVDAEEDMNADVQGRLAKSQAKDEAFARQLEAELNANIDWDDVMEQARKNMMIYLKNMVGFKMDFFKEKGEKEIEEEGSKRKVNDDDEFIEATPLASKVHVVD